MKKDPGRLADYLGHILEAITRIRTYTARMDDREFLDDRLVQDAVIRNLEIIGEACRKIEMHHPEFAAAYPEFPLAPAYQMRNAIAHGYFKVDLVIVWQTIRGDLPQLGNQVQGALDSLSRPGDAT